MGKSSCGCVLFAQLHRAAFFRLCGNLNCQIEDPEGVLSLGQVKYACCLKVLGHMSPEKTIEPAQNHFIHFSTEKHLRYLNKMEVAQEYQSASATTLNDVQNTSLPPPAYSDGTNSGGEPPTYEDYIKNVSWDKYDKDKPIMHGNTKMDSERQNQSQVECTKNQSGIEKPSPLPAHLRRARFQVSRVSDESMSFGSTSSSVLAKADSTATGTQSFQEDDVFAVDGIPNTGETPVIVIGGDSLPQIQEDLTREDNKEHAGVPQPCNSGMLQEDKTENGAAKLNMLFSRNQHQARQYRRSPTPKALKELARRQTRQSSIDMSQVVTESSVPDLEDTEEVTNQTKPGNTSNPATDSCPKGNFSLFQQNIANFGNRTDDVVITVKDLPWLKKPEKCEIVEETEPKPNDYMTLACLVLVCCNIIFGSVAFGFSVATNTTYDKGDYNRARCYSKAAKVIALLGIAFTLVLVIAILAVYWPDKEKSVHHGGIYGV